MTSSAPNVEDLRDGRFARSASSSRRPRWRRVERPASARALRVVRQYRRRRAEHPWGSQGGWAARSLVSTFHQEVRSGERFFRILEDLKAIPATNLPVLELMYYCLSLGFLGQYRLPPHRPGEVDRIREDLYTLISRQRQATDRRFSALAGCEFALQTRSRHRTDLGHAAAALAVVGGLFIWLSSSLNAASDETFSAMLAAPLSKMPAITRVAPVRRRRSCNHLRPSRSNVFLKPEIDEGLVTVIGDHSMPIVRIRNKGMFPSGSGTINQGYYACWTGSVTR